MRDITKSFPGVKALDGVNLKVEKGTVHALMGENKSTLMKILFGQQPPDSGTILFNGQEVHFKSVKEAVNAGISMIYQELSPIKELSIAENVFVGRYPKTRAGAIDWKTMYDSCQKIFDRWGLNYNPRTKIKMLKTADIQMIEIIKAISFNAQLVIMDEPTSSISQNEIEMLYDSSVLSSVKTSPLLSSRTSWMRYTPSQMKLPSSVMVSISAPSRLVNSAVPS